jgi:hypothetical protein
MSQIFRRIKFIGFMLLLILLSFVASTCGQKTRIVLDQSINAVSFSSNQKVWGLEVDGKVVLPDKYKTVELQDGLFKVENTDGQWNVCDKTGSFKLEEWVKATDVKITSDIVLFEKAAAGNMAITYNRNTWKSVGAQEITADDIYNAAVAAQDKKSGGHFRIHGHESLAEKNSRYYRTKPRIVYSGGMVAIKRGSDINIIPSWAGDAKWLKSNVNEVGYGNEYADVDEDADRKEKSREWYLLAEYSDDNTASILWIPADESDKFEIRINGQECGYVKITPHPLHPLRLMMCQTEDGVEHPIWVWGEPLINDLVPHESYNSGDKTKKREELAKQHADCPHCIEQSKIYNEKNK